jgi:MFS family permease
VAFSAQAVSGIAAQIIPANLYANGSAWSSSTWQTASVLGPALGGLLYGFGGAAIAFTVNAVLILLAIVFMTMVPRTPVASSRDGASVKESIREGLHFVFSNQIILAALALDLFAVLFGGAIALLPVFADTVLHVDARVAGLLRAAPAAGAVLMGLWLAHHPLKGAVGRRLLMVVAGFGLCMIAFALSRNVYLSFAILALSGSLDSVSVVIRTTLLQQLTPDNMRGRVSAVNSIFVGSSNEIGEFESGVMARLMGTVPSVIFGGCMTLLVVLITFIAAPKLRDPEMVSLQCQVVQIRYESYSQLF